MDIKQDFFQLYDLPRSYLIDLNQLQRHHRKLQQQFHPDRYVTAMAADQRLAVQVTAYLNQAFKTLKDPVSRGVYLLELAGLQPLAAENTQMPTDFLLQQIGFRESIEAVPEAMDQGKTISDLFNLLKHQVKEIVAEFDDAYKAERLLEAEVAIRKLQFMARLQQQLQLQQEVLID